MSRSFVPSIAIALASLALSAGADAQVLRRASEAVRGESSSSDDSSDGRTLRSASSTVRDSDSSGGSGGGYAPAYSGGGGSRSAWGWNGRRRYLFAPYPYADGYAGCSRPVSEGSSEVSPRAAYRVGLEGGYALAGVGRGALSARVQLAVPFDLNASYSLFLEPLNDGGVDSLTFGRVGIDIRLVDQPDLQVRLGGAARHFHDRQGSVFGADGAVGMDVFPGDPWVFSADVGLGFVGEAMVTFARISAGAMVGPVELFVGYDHQGLGSGDSYVSLGGPMAGLRLWR